ncbi:MAG: FAD:protein FMN transferase [Spirochaetaceae bacterium]|jgi:thiamine biosynthesis lipoprotein|nr:FAD:protein FMN transferase [Spirochaetaceae bacterium]
MKFPGILLSLLLFLSCTPRENNIFSILGGTPRKNNVFSIQSSTPREDSVISIKDFALDTAISIKAYGSTDKEILNDTIQYIRQLEDLLSVHRPDSEISNINNHAGEDWQPMGEDAQALLEAGKDFGELSHGLLDITAGPLIDLWAIDPPHGHVPSQEELDNLDGLIDYRAIEIDQGRARLSRQAMKINLGALAKGYIADRVKDYLLSRGIERALINLGGNVLLVGSKPGNKPFRIGIQDPLSQRGEDLGILEIKDVSLVSSGDYERFFIDSENNKYHHILNPLTGYPSDNGLMQVTVISPDSLQGDGLSTSLFLMGLQDGMALVESLSEVEAGFVMKDKKVYPSSGLKDSYQFTGEPRGYQLESLP